ncbi:MAG TPA: UbiA-like polyprenyltransferase [Lacipirellulaceae bacterium]|nr:UbiA-like polyprenyltransferase [Lacipirellulaceae bacterium]
MLKTTRHLLELIRFSHTLFALPFALLAAVMAWRLQNFEIRWQEVVGILLCMVAARSFAMAFNRIADRHIDATNPRTAGRHLPAGILSVSQVTFFATTCAVGFIAATLLFLPNRLPLMLSIPVLAFLAGYSFAKRFTVLAHFWLGAALALSPIAAWIAIRGGIVLATPTDLLPAIALGGAVITWVAGFDMIYACQDYNVDVAAGHFSIPARVGIQRALRLAAACHLGTIIFLASVPFVYPPFGWLYYGAVAAVAALLTYEHLLVRPDDLTRVNAAFFNVNAIISIGLFLAGSLDLVMHHVGY